MEIGNKCIFLKLVEDEYAWFNFKKITCKVLLKKTKRPIVNLSGIVKLSSY